MEGDRKGCWCTWQSPARAASTPLDGKTTEELELGVRVPWQAAGPKESEETIFKDKISPQFFVVWNWYYPEADMLVVVKTFTVDCFQMLMFEKTGVGENRFVCSLPSSVNEILAPVASLVSDKA